MRDLVVRALSGAVFVAVMLGSIYYDQLLMSSIFFLLVVIGLWEYAKMINRLDNVAVPIRSFVSVGAGLYLLLTLGYFLQGQALLMSQLLVILVLMVYVLSSLFWKTSTSFHTTGLAFFGLFYLVAPFFLMVVIHGMSDDIDGWRCLIALFLIIWTNDTFAYLTGRAIGRTKLFERISPKKTWEGTIGGLVFAMSVGLLLGYSFGESWFNWSVLALFVALAAIVGDLFESMLKRSAGVKDSGNIMPGHGGVLDRFDAVLFGAPVFWIVKIILDNWSDLTL